MTSSISPGESRNSGIIGWTPSAKGRCRSATPYLRFKTRNGGAFVTGLALTLSMAWHCAQCTRTYLKPRLSAGDCSARAGPLSHNSITPSVIAGHRAWDISVPFSSVVSVLHNRVGTSLGGLQGRPVLCLRDRPRRNDLDVTVGIGSGGVTVGPRQSCRMVTTTVERADGRTITRKERRCD